MKVDMTSYPRDDREVKKYALLNSSKDSDLKEFIKRMERADLFTSIDSDCQQI